MDGLRDIIEFAKIRAESPVVTWTWLWDNYYRRIPL